jgi:hypothetical protein
MLTSVALVLYNREGEIFVVEELNEKLHIGKKYGDLSFPWETRENGEADETVLGRLVEEEIDRTRSLVMTPPVCLGKYPVHETEATAYMARYVSGPRSLVGSAVRAGEIQVAHDGLSLHWGWVNPRMLLRMRYRDGVREIVETYLKSACRLTQAELFA